MAVAARGSGFRRVDRRDRERGAATPVRDGALVLRHGRLAARVADPGQRVRCRRRAVRRALLRHRHPGGGRRRGRRDVLRSGQRDRGHRELPTGHRHVRGAAAQGRRARGRDSKGAGETAHGGSGRGATAHRPPGPLLRAGRERHPVARRLGVRRAGPGGRDGAPCVRDGGGTDAAAVRGGPDGAGPAAARASGMHRTGRAQRRRGAVRRAGRAAAGAEATRRLLTEPAVAALATARTRRG